MLRSLALAGALALACVSSAHATVTIMNSPGGNIARFEAGYEALRAAGQDVRIEGYCNSACTMILGIVPRDRICVAPGASFGFHSAIATAEATGESLGYSAAWTAVMRHYYAADVLRILRRHGWDARSPHPNIIRIDGKELREIVKACDS